MRCDNGSLLNPVRPSGGPKCALAIGLCLSLAGCVGGASGPGERVQSDIPDWASEGSGRVDDRYRVVGSATAPNEADARDQAVEHAAEQLIQQSGIELQQIHRSGYESRSGELPESLIERAAIESSGGFLSDMDVKKWDVGVSEDGEYQARVLATLPASTMERMREESEELRPDTPELAALIFGPEFAPPVEGSGVGVASLEDHSDSRAATERAALRAARGNAIADALTKASGVYIDTLTRVEGEEVDVDRRTLKARGRVVPGETILKEVEWNGDQAEAAVVIEGSIPP